MRMKIREIVPSFIDRDEGRGDGGGRGRGREGKEARNIKRRDRN